MKIRKIKIFYNNIRKNIEAGILRNLVVLYVSDDYWIASRGYKLFKYNTQIKKWTYFSRIVDTKNSFFSRFFLSKRLFRAEITHVYRFQNDNLLCIAKKGIFRFDSTNKTFKKCCHIERGSRPMGLCQDDAGNIYFGEYYHNINNNPVHIYKSCDNGENWIVAYTFPQGSINHIHGIFKDPYSQKLWIMTGDLDKECIFGYTENGFKTIIPLLDGTQKCRACFPLFYPDKIVYATDSQYEQNVIREINRETGEVNDVCNIQGSAIYGGQMGHLSFISTTVEPSTVNRDQNSYLWISDNGQKWHEILKFPKDCWKLTYFQFGSIRFPKFDKNYHDKNLIITGRSLKVIDGSSLILPIIIK